MISRLRQSLDPYIILMLATVAVAAIAPARGQGAIAAGAAANVGIVFLFFLYGARLRPQAALSGLTQWKLHLAILLSTFGLFPLLALGLILLVPPGFPPALVTGLLFLSVLPSTVQSSIAFTSIARGNVPAALCAASASNILGVFISPLLAGWLISAHGMGISFGIFRDIMLLLLAPFVVGQLARPWVGEWVRKNNGMLGYADRGSILVIIYVAFSKGVVAGIWSQLRLIDLAALFLILMLLLASVLIVTRFAARRLIQLDIENEIVLQFCGSKKSLASGLPMATVLFPGSQLGMIVLPLMLFHQVQLIVCAVLARGYARRAKVGSSAPPAAGPKSATAKESP